MLQDRSCEADSHTADQTISHLVWNLRVHNHIYKSLPWDPTLSQMNPVHTLTPYYKTFAAAWHMSHEAPAFSTDNSHVHWVVSVILPVSTGWCCNLESSCFYCTQTEDKIICAWIWFIPQCYSKSRNHEDKTEDSCNSNLGPLWAKQQTASEKLILRQTMLGQMYLPLLLLLLVCKD
jgi:hypothetical protein